MNWRKVFWAVVAPKCNGLRSSNSYWHPYWLGVTELWKLTRFGKCENRFQFRSTYLPVRLCYCDRTCTKMKPFLMISTLLVIPHTDYKQLMFIFIYIWSQLWLWNMYILCKTQSPACPQQKWQCWWDSYQNDAHSVLILTLLLISHTNL